MSSYKGALITYEYERKSSLFLELACLPPSPLPTAKEIRAFFFRLSNTEN